MEPIKIRKEKNRIIPAIFFSLLIHISLGAFFFFFMSGNSVSSPVLNGLNLVWVSLDSKSESLNNHHSERLLPAAEAVNEKLKAEEIKKDGHHSDITEKFDSVNHSTADGITDKTSHWGNVIAYPLYKENAPPVYPEIARVRGYEGIVLVFAEILPDGRVGKIKIRKSSGYAILDQSAISAVKPWKFEPAKKSGSPFTAWVELPIKFTLNSNSQS